MNYTEMAESEYFKVVYPQSPLCSGEPWISAPVTFAECLQDIDGGVVPAHACVFVKTGMRTPVMRIAIQLWERKVVPDGIEVGGYMFMDGTKLPEEL